MIFRPTGPKQIKNTKKHYVDKVGPPPARAGGPGGAAPREREKEGLIIEIISIDIDSVM